MLVGGPHQAYTAPLQAGFNPVKAPTYVPAKAPGGPQQGPGQVPQGPAQAPQGPVNLVPDSKLPPPDPATYDDPVKYSDFSLKQAEASEKKAGELQEPFKSKKMTAEKNPMEWGQYLAQRWTATADRGQFEQSIAGEMRAAQDAKGGDPKALTDASHQIAQRYAQNTDAQASVGKALKTVQTETPEQRKTATQLNTVNTAQGKFLALQAKQEEAQKAAPGKPTSFDNQVKEANTALQNARKELVKFAGSELDKQIPLVKGKPNADETLNEAVRLMSERYGADPELTSALTAEWIVRKAEGVQGGPEKKMEMLAVAMPHGFDPVTQDLVLSDPRGAKVVKDYTDWAKKQIDEAGGEHDLDSKLNKFNELTDATKVEPLQAKVLIESQMPLLEKAAKDIRAATDDDHTTNGDIFDVEAAFTNLSTIMDSGLRASSLGASNLVDGTAAPGGKPPPPGSSGLPGLPGPDSQGAPSWFTKLTGELSQVDGVKDYAVYATENGGGSFVSLEIAKQLMAKGDKEGAKEVVLAVSEAHDELEAKLRAPVSEYGELSAKTIVPIQEFAPAMTQVRQDNAATNLRENPTQASKDADNKLEELKESKAAYNYLRSLEGFGMHAEQNTFKDLLTGEEGNVVDKQVTEFKDDVQLQLGVGTSKYTENEIFRIYEDAKRNGLAFDPKAMATAPAGTATPLSFGEATARGAAYAGIGMVIGSLVYSKVNFGTGFTPRVVPMMTEQGLRETALFAGFNGAFSGILDPDASDLNKYMVNSGITLVASAITVTAWDKGLGGRSSLPGGLDPKAFKIPVSQRAIIATLPLTIPGVETFLLKPLMPVPDKIGLDGKPEFDNHFEAASYKLIPIANTAGQVTLAATLAGAYTDGGKALGLVDDAKPWGRAPFKIAGNGNFAQVTKAGFDAQLQKLMQGDPATGVAGMSKAAALGKLAKGAGTTFVLVGANILVSGSVFGQNIDMPAGEYSLQDSFWGQAANVAMPAGLVMTGASWLLAGSSAAAFLGPAGWIVGGIGAVAAISFMAIDKARKSAYMEGPTREYLYGAGFDKGFADQIADHDENGKPFSSRLVALAKMRGEDPAELLEHLQEVYLHGPDGKEQVRDFITAAHRVAPNDKGEFPMDGDKDIDLSGWRKTWTFDWLDGDLGDAAKRAQSSMEESLTKHPDNAGERREFIDYDGGPIQPTNMTGLNLYYNAFLPSAKEMKGHIPAGQERKQPAVAGNGEPPQADPGKDPVTTAPVKDPKTEEPPPKKEPNKYIVGDGDYLWRIAGFDAKVVNQIYALNPKYDPKREDSGLTGDASQLEEGDEIILPEGYKPPIKKYSLAGRSG